jgi:hypothetical protein
MADLTEYIDQVLPEADEFQRIAIAECFRDTEGCTLSATSDEKFARLGAIVLEILEGEPRG